MLQVAEILEIRHHVAQACRRELKPPALRQGARADGLTRGHVLHDDLAQHLAGAGVEIITASIDMLDHEFNCEFGSEWPGLSGSLAE